MGRQDEVNLELIDTLSLSLSGYDTGWLDNGVNCCWCQSLFSGERRVTGRRGITLSSRC